ncbi:MAG TPA: WecB/TagA/CpsF family glycosyltransferase [Acetobacteraceae bacterium]|nr:WecB/TagA/CpsF family glycosyltransferase [Acetobacteraceae bacterium]
MKIVDIESTRLSAQVDDGALVHRWFLGVPFTPLGLAEAAATIAARPSGSRFAFITTPNAHHTVHCARGDKRFSVAHDAAWLVLNDSRILRLLSHWLFGQDLPMTAGSDLTVELFRNYIRPEDAITIIGGTDEVETRLRTLHGMQSVARFNPPMGFIDDPVEIERCVDFILQHPARYVFLAVGAPQSEVVACRVLERGGAVGTALCIGSSLLFVTGVVRRAPLIIRRLNAEWAYRLMQNPRRHARRVFVDSLPVLWLALKALFGRSHERHA